LIGSDLLPNEDRAIGGDIAARNRTFATVIDIIIAVVRSSNAAIQQDIATTLNATIAICRNVGPIFLSAIVAASTAVRKGGEKINLTAVRINPVAIAPIPLTRCNNALSCLAIPIGIEALALRPAVATVVNFGIRVNLAAIKHNTIAIQRYEWIALKSLGAWRQNATATIDAAVIGNVGPGVNDTIGRDGAARNI